MGLGLGYMDTFGICGGFDYHVPASTTHEWDEPSNARLNRVMHGTPSPTSVNELDLGPPARPPPPILLDDPLFSDLPPRPYFGNTIAPHF
jgi:hypothetical protein